jgi:hypothetical protein
MSPTAELCRAYGVKPGAALPTDDVVFLEPP